MMSFTSCLRNAVIQRKQLPYCRFISSSSLVVTPRTDNRRFDARPAQEELTFGTTLSDHMLTCEYKDGAWQAPEIRAYENLSISPAASSLHYGLSCFEGLKAYKGEDGQTRLFRPDKNIARLQASMERLQMPGWKELNVEDLSSLLTELLKIDDRWIPTGDGYSLYLRPTVIATHPYLGLAAPTELLFFVITSPVGPYYKTGFAPITLLATPDYIRAWPGGTGCNKVAGNYAPTMKPQAAAVEQGLSQVLWLFGDDVTEVGGMNVFFVIKNNDNDDDKRYTLVTPPLDRGDILPGVTRDSILHLCRTRFSDELQVEERFPTMTELVELSKEDKLLEAFGAGTAAVVTPIEGIQYEGSLIDIPATGEWTQRFWKELTGIQYGRIEGPEGWSVVV